MQELIEDIKRVIPAFKLEIYEQNFNAYLEKEKEQILDFHVMLMKKGLEQEGNEIEWDYDELRKEAEEYYQTYNQNK